MEAAAAAVASVAAARPVGRHRRLAPSTRRSTCRWCRRRLTSRSPQSWRRSAGICVSCNRAGRWRAVARAPAVGSGPAAQKLVAEAAAGVVVAWVAAMVAAMVAAVAAVAAGHRSCLSAGSPGQSAAPASPTPVVPRTWGLRLRLRPLAPRTARARASRGAEAAACRTVHATPRPITSSRRARCLMRRAVQRRRRQPSPPRPPRQLGPRRWRRRRCHREQLRPPLRRRKRRRRRPRPQCRRRRRHRHRRPQRRMCRHRHRHRHPSWRRLRHRRLPRRLKRRPRRRHRRPRLRRRLSPGRPRRPPPRRRAAVVRRRRHRRLPRRARGCRAGR